jgi:hypothetical protein
VFLRIAPIAIAPRPSSTSDKNSPPLSPHHATPPPTHSPRPAPTRQIEDTAALAAVSTKWREIQPGPRPPSPPSLESQSCHPSNGMPQGRQRLSPEYINLKPDTTDQDQDDQPKVNLSTCKQCLSSRIQVHFCLQG